MALTFELTTPYDDERPVFLAGNFTDWYPDVEKFRMSRVSWGHYELKFPTDGKLPETIHYKYTKGAWEQVELDENGNAPDNRMLRKRTGIVRDFVANWRQNGVSFRLDLMPKIQLIKRFTMPQLKRRRKVYALLPHDYERSGKRYPVLYLQDAQNLFGEGSSYGNWSIDRKLAVLAQHSKGDVIVIAIDHGDKRRLNEYAPYRSRLGQGEGEEYVRFIVETLKPYIDDHFRTLPDRPNTGIGGSSLGGLISLFAGLNHPQIFGKMMIFSPSLWVSNQIYDDAKRYHPDSASKIYLFAGGKEGKYMIPAVEGMRDDLRKWHVQVHLSIDPQGKHQEDRWGREFPRALEWLFFEE